MYQVLKSVLFFLIISMPAFAQQVSPWVDTQEVSSYPQVEGQWKNRYDGKADLIIAANGVFRARTEKYGNHDGVATIVSGSLVMIAQHFGTATITLRRLGNDVLQGTISHWWEGTKNIYFDRVK